MDRAKTYYRYHRGARSSVLVSRRTCNVEAYPKGCVELEVMRILAIVRTNFAENRKMS